MGVAIGGIGDESFLRLAHNTGDERVKRESISGKNRCTSINKCWLYADNILDNFFFLIKIAY